jgi:hypothetical protein
LFDNKQAGLVMERKISLRTQYLKSSRIVRQAKNIPQKNKCRNLKKLIKIKIKRETATLKKTALSENKVRNLKLIKIKKSPFRRGLQRFKRHLKKSRKLP